jgi:integrase
VCRIPQRRDYTVEDELRHSAASRWARQGLSLAEIAQQFGHADIRMTQRYAHRCQQTLAYKIRQMPAMEIYEIVPQPEPRPKPKAQPDKIQ